ncbi:MAG: 3-isopropylmalate dehydrogenase [Phenylobacterium sp.]|uniref:3-isopropylmalate dehydrogenase n=1 Tax=Phenylobacterium sp. TaxID=1871053 RepID=UPI0025CF72B0|nr:3-isopropylmalate dehydrogenase [Phenylobacterium sp.]MBI1200453.1 3-isopropylmalate dehydrogenase [Phenylobacterium sp.]
MAAASEPFRLLVLPGDGIGPEVIEQTLRVVSALSGGMGRPVHLSEALVGGAAIDAHGVPVTDETVARALKSDAVLFGAVGGAKWDDQPIALRPESGLLRLRKELDLFANLRPAICYPELADASSLKRELVEGLDLLVIRELTAGVYFGEPRGVEDLGNGVTRAYDTQAYTSVEVERVVRAAFEIARGRNRRVCSVDKANVMQTGGFWRGIATRVGADYPDVELTHMYADNCAMQIMRRPKQFDVIVTDNLFGDILSDAAAMLTGSLGLLPSASLGASDAQGRRKALYEPVHGSAPDIAGKGLANPLATILSFAMCLRWSMDAPAAADRLEAAVRSALAAGVRTADIAGPGETAVSTAEMTDAVLAALG